MSLSAFETRFQKLLCGCGSRLLRGRQALAILVAYLIFAATYLPINEFSVGRRAHIIYLPGEERLPYLPLFEYLYVLTYFLPLLFLRTIHDYPVFRRLYGAFFIVLLVAYTTYLLFPVYLERPHRRSTPSTPGSSPSNSWTNPTIISRACMSPGPG